MEWVWLDCWHMAAWVRDGRHVVCGRVELIVQYTKRSYRIETLRIALPNSISCWAQRSFSWLVLDQNFKAFATHCFWPTLMHGLKFLCLHTKCFVAWIEVNSLTNDLLKLFVVVVYKSVVYHSYCILCSFRMWKIQQWRHMTIIVQLYMVRIHL